MKALNTLKFISNATTRLTEVFTKIKHAETYKAARIEAVGAMGYIDCVVTFLNTLLCSENNTLTGELHELIYTWRDKVWDSLAMNAIATKQDPSVLERIMDKKELY